MIISHKHRFIFVHCRKAAGSSVVSSLSRYLGPDDLQFSAITDGIPFKIHPPRRVIKEALQTMSAGDLFAVMIRPKSFWGAVSNAIKKKYSGTLGRSPAHAPAAAVAAAFPEEWRDYFKFCVVRNPWDKTLSDYFWKTKRMDAPPAFDEYVNALETGDALRGIVPENHRNWDMYTIDDTVAVNYVVRFEDMNNGLSQALAHTTVKWDGWMPHMKKTTSARSDAPRRDYRDHYSDHAAQVVGRLYEKEIREFDYKF
jgi:hypothetical protein